MSETSSKPAHYSFSVAGEDVTRMNKALKEDIAASTVIASSTSTVTDSSEITASSGVTALCISNTAYSLVSGSKKITFFVQEVDISARAKSQTDFSGRLKSREVYVTSDDKDFIIALRGRVMHRLAYDDSFSSGSYISVVTNPGTCDEETGVDTPAALAFLLKKFLERGQPVLWSYAPRPSEHRDNALRLMREMMV